MSTAIQSRMKKGIPLFEISFANPQGGISFFAAWCPTQRRGRGHETQPCAQPTPSGDHGRG
jgi:hypothetical protein